MLEEIPGVDQALAAVIVADLGNDFAGKKKSRRIPKGNVYLKTALVEAAKASARAKGTYLPDKFFRLKVCHGYKRAAVAVAHKILTAIYHLLTHQNCYHELGDLYLDKLERASDHPTAAQAAHRSGL